MLLNLTDAILAAQLLNETRRAISTEESLSVELYAVRVAAAALKNNFTEEISVLRALIMEQSAARTSADLTLTNAFNTEASRAKGGTPCKSTI